MDKNKSKILWYSLIILQVIIYSHFLGLKYLFEDYTKYILVICMATSASISYLLTYSYYLYLKKEYISKKVIILFISLSWFISLLLIIPVLLFGYIMIALFLIWFLFTIVFIGIKYIFKKNEPGVAK